MKGIILYLLAASLIFGLPLVGALDTQNTHVSTVAVGYVDASTAITSGQSLSGGFSGLQSTDIEAVSLAGNNGIVGINAKETTAGVNYPVSVMAIDVKNLAPFAKTGVRETQSQIGQRFGTEAMGLSILTSANLWDIAGGTADTRAEMLQFQAGKGGSQSQFDITETDGLFGANSHIGHSLVAFNQHGTSQDVLAFDSVYTAWGTARIKIDTGEVIFTGKQSDNGQNYSQDIGATSRFGDTKINSQTYQEIFK